jgi:hypothetical protein
MNSGEQLPHHRQPDIVVAQGSLLFPFPLPFSFSFSFFYRI